MSFATNPHDVSIEEGIRVYQGKAAQAIDAIRSKGFGVPNPPTIQTATGIMAYQGQLPQNLPDLSDSDLGRYMGLLTEWNAYVQYQLAEASVHLSTVKSILEHVEAKLRIVYAYDDAEGGKKRSNPERDDHMTTDRRFMEAKSDVIYWETLHTSIRAIANSAEQAFAAVSRRITQRGQEIDRGNRAGGLGKGSNVQLPQGGPMFGRTY